MMKPNCLCSHPHHLHSIYHNGRCLGIERTSISVDAIPVDYPCTCIEYDPDDGTDGNLQLHPPIIGKPKGA